MTYTNLAERMKAYEAVTDHRLTPNSWVIIRVDGRAFHSYTKQEAFQDFGPITPFSRRLQTAMITAMAETAKEMQGFRLAYTQSDEATFAITDTGSHEAEGWFGYRLAKLQSIAASTFISGCVATKASWNGEWDRATFFLIVALVLLR